jgi:predicted transcriptional regulator
MTGPSVTDELLAFFKALADANRLRIVGVLATQEASVEQLAACLDLRPSTISHHLSKLREAGLVSARAEGYYSIYNLDREALEAQARRLLSRDQVAAVAEEVDMDAYDRKVLSDFSTPDGRLKEIPAQRRKRAAVLRFLAHDFEGGVTYPEAAVNEILRRYHEDTATLRREMVAEGLLGRDRGGYWRTGPSEEG